MRLSLSQIDMYFYKFSCILQFSEFLRDDAIETFYFILEIFYLTIL